MPRITVHADCENSPIKALLRDLNIAFAKNDIEGILDLFTDDIRWQIVGAEDLRGIAAVRASLEAMSGVATRELVIDSIITAGREGAVNGVIASEQGGSVAFCDVCEFESASGDRIKSMKSYTVELKTKPS